MPIFGDYETVGEPVAVANESGHVTTVWRASKSGAAKSAGEFAVKVYAPRRKTAPGDAGESLDRDRALEFLEGVKQLKKAQTEGARSLAPIHAFGNSEEGAWFVTDYFQRGSLAAWINRRVNVDSAALRQIVACLVGGCLDLKRSRGNSHGNLKTTNVFLVGPTRPLRKTPLALTDAHPAAPMKLAGLGGEDRQTADELLHQVMEAQDLRAIGEIILQLVEGRLVSNAYDYNYPVPRSAVWNLLGKEGERWRALCNQLLDPQLSLEETNLETLAKKFPAGGKGGGGGKVLGAVAALALLGLAGGGAYGWMKWSNQQKGAQFEKDLSAARESFDRTNMILAWDKINLALNKKPEDGAAVKLKADIEKRNGEECANGVKVAGELLHQKNYPEALRQLDWVAANLRPSEALASQLSQLKSNLQTEQDFGRAMEAGQKAYDLKNYPEAMTQVQAALDKKPNDSAAAALRKKVQTGLDNQSDAQRQKNYDAAMESGRAAYSAKKYAEAIKQADAALISKPEDSAATKLKRDAEKGKYEADLLAEREGKYIEAMDAGRKAFEGKKYDEAVNLAGLALGYKPDDEDAKNLQREAQAALRETAAQAEQSRKYREALTVGQKAYAGKDYATAIQQADAALANRSGDAAATKLKADAQQAQANAEREQKYNAVMTAGLKAFGLKDYAGAIAQADAALKIKSDDPDATKLKTEATGLQAAARTAAQKKKDLEEAQGFMVAAKYLEALGICNKYLKDADFDRLSKTIVVKQADYNDSVKEFETLLVNFNVIKASAATHPDAKKETMFPSIDDQYRETCKSTTVRLESKFRDNNWLTPERQKNFTALAKSIKNYL